MRSLANTLRDQDTGYIRIVADLWGIELTSEAQSSWASTVAGELIRLVESEGIQDQLPKEGRVVLEALQANDGRLPVTEASRRFGGLREMGPGRRDRERPWRDPQSGLEILWYRGLIGRAFLDTSTGPKEFFFLPEDLARKFPKQSQPSEGSFGQPHPAPKIVQEADGVVLEDVATLLAGLRRHPMQDQDPAGPLQTSWSEFLYIPHGLPLLLSTLTEMGVITGPPWSPEPESARELLGLTRLEIQNRLIKAWIRSASWNDLAQVDHLRVSGERWPNDPVLSRKGALELLSTIPVGKWWSMEAFLQDVHSKAPDFQRPGGDFDSWYLFNQNQSIALRGFEHWWSVEAPYLRSLLSGPLHWLGVSDLGRSERTSPIEAFRLRHPLPPLLKGETLEGSSISGSAPMRIERAAKFFVPRGFDLGARYQLARASRWLSKDENGYRYQLSARSLSEAAKQGLQPDHLLTLFESLTSKPVPTYLQQALSRYQAQGVEAKIERMVLLRLKSKATLELLQTNRVTKRFLGERLGETTVQVRERDWVKLVDAAIQLGVFIERPEPGPPVIP